MTNATEDRRNGATGGHRALEISAIVVAPALASLLVARIVMAEPSPRGWMIVIAAVLGYLTADLISGLVHWTFDTWGSATTPLIGQGFIRPFREHHTDPLSITRHDFVATNGNTCLASLPLLTAAAALPLTSAARLLAALFLLSLALGLLATNQIHKWAHVHDPGPVVRRLQRWRLILTPEHHRVHHVAPYATHYCITTGWLNAMLAALRFHRRAERAIAVVTGARRR